MSYLNLTWTINSRTTQNYQFLIELCFGTIYLVTRKLRPEVIGSHENICQSTVWQQHKPNTITVLKSTFKIFLRNDLIFSTWFFWICLNSLKFWLVENDIIKHLIGSFRQEWQNQIKQILDVETSMPSYLPELLIVCFLF